MPSGYRLVWAGEFGQLQAAKERLAIVVPVSLVLILGLLYALFNSARECLLALLGIPFVIAGGIFALYVFGLSFSISAAIGFVSLFGVVRHDRHSDDHDATSRRACAASPPSEAMLRAATHVMRPLLMMSLSAGIGLLPAALSTGIGSEVQRPLAAVVVGGMLLGSILLLVVVPACYMPFLGRDSRASPGGAHMIVRNPLPHAARYRRSHCSWLGVRWGRISCAPPRPMSRALHAAAPLAPTASAANVAGGEAQRFLAGQDIPGEWWELFESPGLNALVERALKANPDLKAAEAALTVAHENMLAQRGAYYPTVSAGFAASRTKTSAQLSPTPSSGALLFNLFTPEVSVSFRTRRVRIEPAAG